MEFKIEIRHEYKILRYIVVRQNATPRTEQFKIIAKNRTVILESNRPFLLSKGLKHRKPDWKIIEGDLGYASVTNLLINAILKKLEG